MSKNVATITISGPVGCGKSLVAKRIQEILADEFGVVVATADRDTAIELSLQSPSKEAANWERQMVTKTTWEICEVVKRV